MNAVNHAAQIASGVGAGTAVPSLGFGAVLQTLFGLVIVIGFVFGCAWLARKFGFQGGKRTGLVKVVGGASLGEQGARRGRRDRRYVARARRRSRQCAPPAHDAGRLGRGKRDRRRNAGARANVARDFRSTVSRCPRGRSQQAPAKIRGREQVNAGESSYRAGCEAGVAGRDRRASPGGVRAKPAGLPAFNTSPGPNGGTTYSLSVQTMLLLTMLSFLPAMLLMMTSFTRIIIVLSLLRQALGTPARRRTRCWSGSRCSSRSS